MKINGNTHGIKQTLLERMEGMYDMRCVQNEFASDELIHAMSEYTGLIEREISVYIARDGRIVDVSVGDAHKVTMPSMRLVRNEDRLCGVRCIHTHPNGDGRLSGVDLGTLRSMKLDCMAAIGVRNGLAATMYAAYVGAMTEGERKVLIYGPLRPYNLPHRRLLDEIAIADELLKSSTKDVMQSRPERAILVGIDNGEPYDTLEELKELALTAGADVVGRDVQRRRTIDNATYIGSGKTEELSLMSSELEADLFIFDDELNAIQLRNLEDALGARVIDRTSLILDIFAARATTREGKLQVELAQLKYRLPRLTGKGASLSRLGGGIGTRGPGEKKLEIDRRRIRRRIFELEEELVEIKKQRALRREKRERNATPLVALVGYTNAGKSTLLNAMSDAGVIAEDKLFATLDPVVRQIELSDGTNILISDTVGFINKLPHDLVSAFRATLEEVSGADLIIHVIDSSSSYMDTQISVVEDVLCTLGAADKPRINAYNKIDIASGRPSGGVCISALNGDGLAELMHQIEGIINNSRVEVELVVPYSRYEAIAMIRDEGVILSSEHEQEGTRVRALLHKDAMWRIKRTLNEAEKDS